MDHTPVPEMFGPALRERLGGYSRGTSLSERLRSIEEAKQHVITDVDALVVELDQ